MPVRGQAGGRATVAKHGSKHMAEIGRRGFQSFCDRYFSGDRSEATSWLHRRAYEKQADSYADRVLAERMAKGDSAACVELPIVSEPDEVPF